MSARERNHFEKNKRPFCVQRQKKPPSPWFGEPVISISAGHFKSNFIFLHYNKQHHIIVIKAVRDCHVAIVKLQ